MIYPDVELSAWLKKYPLKVRDYTCPNCHGVFQTIKPVLIKGYACLESEIHGCGKAYTAVTMTPIGKDEIRIWKEILG